MTEGKSVSAHRAQGPTPCKGCCPPSRLVCAGRLPAQTHRPETNFPRVSDKPPPPIISDTLVTKMGWASPCCVKNRKAQAKFHNKYELCCPHLICLAAVGREGGEAREQVKGARRYQPPTDWRSQCCQVTASEVSYMPLLKISSTKFVAEIWFKLH